MGNVEKVRGSSADRALACAGSIPTPAHPINFNTPEANFGRAVHAACEPIAHGLEPNVAAVALEYGVDPKELGFLVHFARQAWAEVREYFPDPQTEQKVEGPFTRGRVDVLSVTPEVLAFLDWKSGRVSDEHPGQLHAYADATRAQYWEPSSGEILGVEVWLRSRELRIHRITIGELNGFRERIEEQLRRQGRQYAPGPHCRFCPHVADCEPRVAYIQSTANAIAETDESGLADRDHLASLWQRSRDLRSALGAYEQAVGAALIEGPLKLGDGVWLERHETEVDQIDAHLAWPVLQELGLSEGQIADSLKMSKTPLLESVRDNVVAAVPEGEKMPRGAIGRAKAEAMDRLRKVDAVSTRTKVEKRIIRD